MKVDCPVYSATRPPSISRTTGSPTRKSFARTLESSRRRPRVRPDLQGSEYVLLARRGTRSLRPRDTPRLLAQREGCRQKAQGAFEGVRAEWTSIEVYLAHFPFEFASRITGALANDNQIPGPKEIAIMERETHKPNQDGLIWFGYRPCKKGQVPPPP